MSHALHVASSISPCGNDGSCGRPPVPEQAISHDVEGSLFPVTIFDGDTGVELYRLKIDPCVDESHPVAHWDGLPAELTLRLEPAEGDDVLARHVRVVGGL